ncbi:MCP four helix bundle domain-containing protein, partial [Propionibacterium freudenreichii]|uniref:MCP four helix bundle domain-containing protein n=1 Tax=Propionibacterium freudenreichii TaxID=1744 RepID=UPI003853BD7A
RLALGFATVAALGVGIVAYAAYALNDLDRHVEELATNRMVKVAQFGEVHENMQSICRFARNVIIQPEPAFVAEEKKKIAELRD